MRERLIGFSGAWLLYYAGADKSEEQVQGVHRFVARRIRPNSPHIKRVHRFARLAGRHYPIVRSRGWRRLKDDLDPGLVSALVQLSLREAHAHA